MGEGQLTVEQATQVYDLFEAVVETELESLRALLISIEVGKWVEVALCVSAGGAALRAACAVSRSGV